MKLFYKKPFAHLGDVLGDLSRELGLRDAMKLEKIRADWRTLFKSPLCDMFSPAIIETGRLTVNVLDSKWLAQINYYRKDVLNKLHNYGVNAITLRVGNVTVVEEPVTPQVKELKPWPPTGSDADDIEEITAMLVPGLREAAARAYARHLGYDTSTLKPIETAGWATNRQRLAALDDNNYKGSDKN